MSNSAVNPMIKGPLAANAEKVLLPVAAAQTYKKGQCFILTSGQATLCADGDIPDGQFMTTVDTAVAANTRVKCLRWRVGTRLEMYVASGGSSSAITSANIGIAYDLQIISNVFYLDIGATTDKVFKVLDVASHYDTSGRSLAADDPGRCIVEVMKVSNG